ncbi:MAG: iron-sulfur cluster repair di-iron protein [Balneolaceae bacterium]|nr:iron-sulfur cluster repair di-iron protein [Balneolaceae bacterium]
MNAPKNQTIGQIVSEDYRAAGIFKKFGLDFCCGGKRTVSEACEKKGVDLEELTSELQTLNETESNNQNYNDWSPSFLIDYIINNHHQFVRTKLPEISAYTKKVAKVHGRGRPGLVEIRDIFLALQPELLEHLEKEEQVLFPYIKTMLEYEQQGSKLQKKPDFKTVKNPVRMMEAEHDEAGSAMEKIQELTDNFTPPKDACATYRVLFQNLEAFQNDLHKHVHLENNILFPKALALEKRVN